MEKKNIKKENLKKGPQFESAKNESSYHWVKKVVKWIKMKRPAYEDISDYV